MVKKKNSNAKLRRRPVSALPPVIEESPSSQGGWKVYALIGFVSIACYSNGLDGDFIHDDIPAIVTNKDVLAQNPIRDVFKNDFWGTPMFDKKSHKSFRPLTTLTFRANYLLFGLQPFWFHLTNTLLHMAACLLFTRMCYSVAKMQNTFVIIAGLLFAVHPIHTEAVTGLVGRADVLACIFFFISILLYHESESGYFILSILFGALSLFAKETGIMVIVLNMAFDFYRNWPDLVRAKLERKFNSKTAWFVTRTAIATVSLILLLATRLNILQTSLPTFTSQDNPAAFHSSALVRFLTFNYLAAFNWWMILYPKNLSHDWQMGSIPLITTWEDSRNLLTCVAFLITMFLIFKSVADMTKQKNVPLVLGILLLILPFIPASNLFVTVGFVVAERLLYIPSSGTILIVTWGIKIIWQRSRLGKTAAIILVSILLVCGASKTMERNLDWKSKETLLKSDLVTLPHNAKIHYNMANSYKNSDLHLQQAIDHYIEAIRLWPMYVSAYNNLGTIVDIEKAEKCFLAAIKCSKDHPSAYYNLGKIYRNRNNFDDSLKMFEKCVEACPTYLLAHVELLTLKPASERSSIFKTIINIEPQNWVHRAHYAKWLEFRGLRLMALKTYLKAFRISETSSFKDKGDVHLLQGACLILRSLGQKSKILQLHLRWHIGKRGEKPGIMKSFYLFHWKLNKEISDKAKLYSSIPPSEDDDNSQLRLRQWMDRPVMKLPPPHRNYKIYATQSQEEDEWEMMFHFSMIIVTKQIFEIDDVIEDVHEKGDEIVEETSDWKKSVCQIHEKATTDQTFSNDTIDFNVTISEGYYISLFGIYRVNLKIMYGWNYIMHLGEALGVCKKDNNCDFSDIWNDQDVDNSLI